MDTQLPKNDGNQSSADLIKEGVNGLDEARPTFEYLNSEPSASADSPTDAAAPAGAIMNAPQPATAAKPAVNAASTTTNPDAPAKMKPAEKARLRREVSQRARGAASPERLTAWLVSKGLPQAEAEHMASSAIRSEEARKKAALAQRRQDVGLAWAEIIGGVVLLIAGLAAGWFVGLFLVPIFDGFRRLAN